MNGRVTKTARATPMTKKQRQRIRRSSQRRHRSRRLLKPRPLLSRMGTLGLLGFALSLSAKPIPIALAATAEDNNGACKNGGDDDADGLIDCLDNDCDNIGICEFGTESLCSDGEDNDYDGDIDAADSDCGAAASCPVANPAPPAVLGATDVISFKTGSLIIPMDGCYQRPSFMSDSEVTDVVGTPLANEVCNTNSEKDDGIIPAYTLMFRLVEAGIPVHWSIKDGKTGWHDTDFTVLRAGGSPVAHYEPAGTLDTTKYAAINEIKYRGAPFVVADDYAAAAITLIDSLSGTCQTGTCYSEVDIHIAQADFDAPIYQEIGGLPKIAILDLGDGPTALSNEKTNFLAASIDESLMASLEGSVFEWLTIPDVNNGDLISDSYELVWVPPFDLTDGATATVAQQTFIANLSAFADAGGSILFQDGSVAAMEGYGDGSPGYSEILETPTDAGYQTNGGVYINGASGTWDNGNANETTVSEDYSDPASQFGGLVWTGIGGSKYNWRARCDAAYADGVRRMIYTDHLTDDSQDDYDMASWRRKDNDPDKGVIYYLGGSNWRRVTAAGFRILMNTVLAESSAAGSGYTEAARSSPILAQIPLLTGNLFQLVGTFETNFEIASAPQFTSVAASAATFDFPDVKGHYRAIDLTAIATAGSTDTDYADLDANGFVDFDTAVILPLMTINTAGDGCAYPADGVCRRIFTNIATNLTPLTLGNRDSLSASTDIGFSGTEADWLIERIHEGVSDGAGGFTAGLGGIDRSTAAIIEASSTIGTPEAAARPTIAYVGGTDGMLHAICAEVKGPCPRLGTELWAFMPRTELGKVATNKTRVDGSPKVSDVFADFDDDGVKEYKTVLAFQSGNSSPAATYALDISDPSEPEILWEHITNDGGTTLAMGSVYVPGTGLTHLTFAHTAAGTGPATPGMVVTAIETGSGDALWQKSYSYTSTDIPDTAYPGGVTVFSSTGASLVDTVLVPSLQGEVYSLSASDGTDNNSDQPIFKFSSIYHPIGAPISLYRGASDYLLHGVAVSGGFTDSQSPSASSWAPSNVNQYAVGFLVNHQGAPVTELTVQGDSSLGIFIDFGQGNRAFSQAVIAGNEIFIVTDTENVNASGYGSSSNTGTLYRSSLNPGATSSSTALASGAASPDVDPATGTVYTSGGDGVARSTPAGFDSAGTSVEASAAAQATRFLWLRSQ